MAMSTSSVAIRNKNLRHIYYGQPIDIMYRTSGDYPNFDQLRLQKSDRDMKARILQSARLHYAAPPLEPAPAFKCVSTAEAEEIGKRLYDARKIREEQKNEEQSRESTPGNGPKLHRQLTYTAQIQSSRNPSAFVGRHQYVNNVAQPQVIGH